MSCVARQPTGTTNKTSQMLGDSMHVHGKTYTCMHVLRREKDRRSRVPYAGRSRALLDITRLIICSINFLIRGGVQCADPSNSSCLRFFQGCVRIA